MSFGVFWFAWLFVALGFLPFYLLHNNQVIGLFIIFWLGALILRWSKLKAPLLLKGSALVVVSFTIWQTYGSLRSVEATAGLLALLAVLKLWESHSTRDAFLFFLIFQLMMVAQYLSMESLWLLGFIVVSTVLMFAVFMDLQSNQKSRGIFFNRGKRLILSQTLVAALLLASALFFIFPRSNFTFFVRTSKNQIHPWSGFSTELRPGSITSLMQDDEVTFRVRFAEQNPPLSVLYWQGATLIDSDGFNWQRDASIIFSLQSHSKDAGRFLYQADMADNGEGAVFLLNPVANFKLLSPGLVRWRGLEEAIVAPLSSKKTSWRASLAAVPTMKMSDETELARAREVPTEVSLWLHQNFPQFQSMDARSLMAALEVMFQRDFTYSLEPGSYSGTPLNQLKSFLQQRKVGVCEHFASASALILRAFGHPAIISVGFHGGQYNELGDYWSVRGRDAHAWVMVYDQTQGWLRFDPTKLVAPDRLTLGATAFSQLWRQRTGAQSGWEEIASSAWFNGLVKIIDSTYYQLNLAFINYDAEAQRQILAKFGLENWRKSALRWLSIVLVVITISVFWWLQRDRSQSSWYVVNRLYGEFVESLRQQGINVSRATPPLELKDRLQVRTDAKAWLEFLDVYVKMKYATASAHPARKDERELQRLWKNVRRQMRFKS